MNGISLTRMQGLHPDLLRVIARLEQRRTDFIVVEGLRTEARQKQLVKAGASRTMRSRHLTGHAVDLGVMVGGKLRWDWPLYARLAVDVKACAAECGVLVEWGGDWRTFKDGPHYQLPWSKYPVKEAS